MKHVQKSVLLWYSPRQMFDLVTAVPDYPKFLPWCERAEVLEQDEQGMTARLHLAFAGIRQTFTTRNRHVADQRVEMSLVDGPFRQLDGAWVFAPLGADGQACKIGFDLAYAFAGGTLERVLSPVFDRVANTFVDSFVKRAEAVYGDAAGG